jgi:hypothetical protein
MTRLNVPINDSTTDEITTVVDGERVTNTEAVRLLIAWGAVVYAAVRQGKTVLIKDGNDVQRVILHGRRGKGLKSLISRIH